MAHVVDVYEPWLGHGYSSYDANECAKQQGVPVERWVEVLRQATKDRGGEVVYEGDPDDRPQWLKDALDKA